MRLFKVITSKYLFVFALCAVLHIALLTAQTIHFPSSKVVQKEGITSFSIDGKDYPPYAYMSYLGEPKFYQEIAQQGLHIYNIPAYLGDRGINSTSGIKPFRAAIWQKKGPHDFSSITTDFEAILSVDPNAKVILRLHLDPPTWWEEQNPGNSAMQPDGSTYRFSLFSENWRKDASEVLKQCIHWLNDSKYANHLIGIHVAAGFTEEWFYHYKDKFHDLNPIRTQHFRHWLKSLYKTNKALQESWNNDQVTFQNAELANISGEWIENRWRDLAKEMNYYDTFRFQAENMVDHIIHFCKLVKKESHRHLLTGAFYGYHNFVQDPRRGHGALYQLLQCKDLDYLSSPNDYNRQTGVDWLPMAAVHSVHLHGKLWMTENDTRTSITTLLKDRAPHISPGEGFYVDGVWLGPESMEISESFLWKNLGRMLAYGYGGWWFDMWGGWFSDPRLLHVIQSGQQFHQENKRDDFSNMDADFAVFVDEKLAFRDASFGGLSGQLLSNRYELGKLGAPYDLYLREDLEQKKPKKYQIVWLLGILDLTPSEQDWIKQFVQAGGTVLHTDHQETVKYHKDSKNEVFQDKRLWNATELAALRQSLGLHQYIQAGDVFYAGNGWLCLHATAGGEKTIHLPFKATIKDAISGTTVVQHSKEFKSYLKPGETKLWRIQ
ncbi:hypothetical protein ACFRAE_03575 [Sphingobacterium sp. HJSM2_6]|uniref:hypothetical protein n=1 Tax=Sphingobacterium sp. HJSM2_6 TaxID=3366264 RepID=UPI003BCC79EB